MSEFNAREFGRKVVSALVAHIAKALAPYNDKIEALAQRLDNLAKAQDSDRQEMLKAVANAVSRVAPADPIEPPSVDDVIAGMKPALDALMARVELDADRRLTERHDRLLAALPKPQDGAPGKDGVSIEDFEIEERHGGRYLDVAVVIGGEKFTKSMRTSMLIDRGVYSSGSEHLKGDCVTYQGGLWVANVDTSAKPGESTDWRLMVKKGKDGKDGRDVNISS